MFQLKTLSPDAIPLALKMAERYRLLNEPYEAGSICEDVLQVAPDNQDALIMLLLSYTDRFVHGLNPAFSKAQEVLERLSSRYCSAYYSGIILERRAKFHMESHQPGSGEVAHQWFTKAMEAYDLALNKCSPGNQDALLRWNTCARILNDTPHVSAGDGGSDVHHLDSYE